MVKKLKVLHIFIRFVSFMPLHMKGQINILMQSNTRVVGITALLIWSITFYLERSELMDHQGKLPIHVDKVVSILFLESLDSVAIVSAGLIYIKDRQSRQKQDHYLAWQVIDAAYGAKVSTSRARIVALENLNEDGESLEDLDLPWQEDKDGSSNLQIIGADLKGIQLPQSNLARSTLKYAQFCQADLRESNLHGANLYGSDLNQANLHCANLSASILSCSKLDDTDLRDTSLMGADLSQASLNRAALYRANLMGSNLKNSSLISAKLNLADLSSSILDSADLSGAQMENTKLKNTILLYANLSYVQGLTESQLDDAYLYGIVLPHYLTFINPNRDYDIVIKILAKSTWYDLSNEDQARVYIEQLMQNRT